MEIIKTKTTTYRRSVQRCQQSLLLLWITTSTLSCKNDGQISLSNDNDTLGAEISDSTLVRAATYQLDPLPSNGRGLLLVGAMDDAITGKLQASTYFRIGNSAISGVSIPDDAKLDSVTLALPYHGYYYGDTSATQEIFLHRLVEDIKLIDASSAWEDDEIPVFASGSSQFTNSVFAYEGVALGNTSFKPKPRSKADTVFIQTDRSFAQELWTNIKEANSQITHSDEFLNYIKGFVLLPGKNVSNIIAFPTDSLRMIVYYSYTRTTDGKGAQAKLDMKVDDRSYQFNHLQVDRSKSSLWALPSTGKAELPASNTQEQLVLQGLSGLVTKIQFPSLHAFVNRNDVVINKAELIIETAQHTHAPFNPPALLNMMLADKHGVPKSLLTTSYGTNTIQNAYLYADYSGGARQGRYTFNLTEYVSKLRGADEDTESALYLTIPVTDLLTKVDRLVIGKGDGTSMLKLRILYTKY